MSRLTPPLGYAPFFVEKQEMELLASEGASLYIWLVLSVAGGLIACTRRKERYVDPCFGHIELWYTTDGRWFLHLWFRDQKLHDSWSQIPEQEALGWLAKMDAMKVKCVSA